MTKGQIVGAFAMAVICGAALAWLCHAQPAFGRHELCGGQVQTVLFVILTMVLVVDLPICFLILIGKPPIMTLSPLIPSAEERANWKRLKERELLDDDAFYERFYAGTGIPKEIPLRLTYQEQLTKAAEQLRLLQRILFGQRRERYAPSPDQKLLFVPEMVEGLDTQSQNSGDANADSLPPRKPRRPRRPRIEFPQFWEHRQKDYPLPEVELPCACCGQQRVIIRTHITKRAEMEEAKLYVIEETRYTYGCSHCHDGSQMVTTQRPPQAVEKSPFGPSILAWLVTWKFLHHLPVYRQQELLLGPLKRWLSRALLCGLLARTAQALHPWNG